MKGHKGHHHGRKHREAGGVNEAEMDVHSKPESRVHAPKITDEAEAATGKKHGGRAKRKHGGHAMHHEMKVDGHHAKHHAGRKPRKSGGGTFSNNSPFTSAKPGTPAKGRPKMTKPEIED